MSEPLATILFVCTGNICRSAYGHHLLAGRLEEAVPGRYRVASAGTQVNPRLTVPPQVHALPRAGGLRSLADHVPTQLSGRAVAKADLLLAATSDHSAVVLRDTPAALNRSFTMLEFGAAARAMATGAIPAWSAPAAGASTLAEDVRSLARHVSRHRPAVRGSLTTIDLPDPYGREDAAYTDMATALEPAVEHITDLLVTLARRG
ncbi:MAG: phosphotyrosine protein phosphatase [Micrococcus sp.]|nr:phosphotyrosine protein phosphatase [Micrococcus sp.]